ncbi:MAG: hypothetical protein KDA28_00890, partial [Phycisphaerales bacterium]|nr:hypothetical protein [Phycisphaerales bacterium]
MVLAKMKAKVERFKVHALYRLGYLLAAPVVLVVALYLAIFLAANSRQGSELAAEQVNKALPATIEFAYLEVGPFLNVIDLYDVRVSDMDAREIISARHVRCRFSASGLLLHRVDLRQCDLEDGRVLVHQADRGERMGMVNAWDGRFHRKGRGESPITVTVTGIDLENVDVLVNLGDLVFRFDGIDAVEGYMVAGRGALEMGADALDWHGGRILVSDRLLSLGTGKDEWEMVAWEIQRRNRPWIASRAELPEGAGVLDLPLGRGNLENVRMRDSGFQFDAMDLIAADAHIEAAGWLRLFPEDPKLGPLERGVIMFDGEATVGLTPDSPIIDYFFPGGISTLRTPERRGEGEVE